MASMWTIGMKFLQSGLAMSQPIKRPTANETEEDLLKLQAEFMKKKQGQVKKDVIDINQGMGHEPPQSVNRKRKISKEVV